MIFDVDDLDRVEERGGLVEVILHEMGHVLGFGSLWGRLDLIRDPTGFFGFPVDTHFAGSRAIEAFDQAGGTDYTDGAKVPVENVGGRGSRDSHWRESLLDDELMTSRAEVGDNALQPLSAITIQSMADMGYTVDPRVAEPYRLPMGAAAVVDPVETIEYGDDVWTGPIFVVDGNGRVVRVIRR